MLGRLESKLAALVSEAAGRAAGLGVLDPPEPGHQTIAVAVTSIAVEPGFVPADTTLAESAGKPRSRRVLPVRFEATIDLRSRPGAGGAVDRAAARAELMSLVSTIAHRFGDREMQSGGSFATGEADPGFNVLGFGLVAATLPFGLADGSFAAQIVAGGRALLWPQDAGQEEGVIGVVQRIVAPLPVAVHVADAALPPGAATDIFVELGAIDRSDSDTELAVSIRADVPLDERGTISAAQAGAEPGVAIVGAPAPEVTLRYQAPAGDPGAGGRLDHVDIHLATPDRRRGVLLGTAAIRLVAAP